MVVKLRISRIAKRLKPQGSLQISVLVVAVLTILGKVSGLFREQVMALFYGASVKMDAFNVAYYLPNVFRALIADAALISAFIPLMTSYTARGDRKLAKSFMNTVLNLITIVMSVLVVISYPFLPWLIGILPGMKSNPALYGYSLNLTRIMLPILVILSVVGLISAILNSFDRFAAVAASPVMFNIVTIIFVFLGDRYLGVYSLGLGVLVGTLFQLVVLILAFRRIDMKYAPEVDLSHPGLRRLAVLMLPVILSYGCVQINESVDKIFALSIGTGYISVLNYAVRIWYFPLGIFGVAVSTVFFPGISKRASLGDDGGLKSMFSLGLREILFLMLPSTAGLMVLSQPIVKLVYERGQFLPSDTYKVALTLLFYSIGLAPYASLTILNRVFYALGDTLTPLIVAAISIVSNFVFDYVLIKFMSYAGLALSTSLVGVINFVLLMCLLRRKIGRLDGKRITTSALKMLAASTVMATVVFVLYRATGAVFGESGLGLAFHVMVLVLVGAASYLVLCYLFRLKEVDVAIRKIGERFLSR